MDNLTKFFTEHPAAIGIFIALLGLLFLLASIFDWNWIFGDVSAATYDTGKLDGLINLFGRKTARIIFGAIGAIVFLSGILAAWSALEK
jgi:preprotein translocase subunit SecF